MENIELQKAIAEFDDFHKQIIADHVNFLKLRNPPKWYIVKDLQNTFAGWLSDKKLAKLVKAYIEMYS